MKQGKMRHRSELLNESDYTIVMTYQLEYRGLANYSLLAYNLHSLHLLKWVMEQSLTKTLAHKHKTSVTKIYEKYRAEIPVDGRIYKGLQVTVPRENKPP
ncbi:MAG TPA: group II intron reverse transcriptase/maturase [Ktedonobacteraceae bacterium]|nr:group II intron reverse transcriptase/maturase [Ktedonobacteraceae bacterium]